MRAKKSPKSLIKKVGISILILLVLYLLFLFHSPNISDITTQSRPTTSYEESFARIDMIKSLDTDAIDPVCHSILMTHGKKVEKVVVFFHGFTNCPKQFEQFGKQLFDRGFNVFIPRIPQHGMKDKMTSALSSLTAPELASFSTEMTDIAAGLGEKVIVSGISAGGIMSAWVGQTQNVHKIVAIAPNFAYSYPAIFHRPMMNYALTVPNYYRWWDKETKDKGTEGPLHAYPRYPTRALGEVMRLGFAVLERGKQEKPRAQQLTLVTIGGDEAVNNEFTHDLAQNWKESGSTVYSYEFDPSLHLIHDIIDPLQVKQRTDIVYPVLIELLLKD